MRKERLSEHATKQFLICLPDSKSLANARHNLGDQPFSWAYLGSSVSEFNLTTKAFGERATFIDTAQRFHEAGLQLRDDYLRYVYNSGRGFDSLRWWVTSFSYRSRYLSKTFHRICHLKTGLDTVAQWNVSEPLILVADVFVGSALEENLAGLKANIHRFEHKRLGAIRKVKDLIDLVKGRLYFIGRDGIRIFQIRRIIPDLKPVQIPTTVILSWATRENIHHSSAFHESYFGELAARLTGFGCNVAVSPIILRDLPYKAAVRQILGSETPILVPHRYVSFFKLLKIAISTLTRPPMLQRWPSFRGMNISILVEEDMRRHWISNGAPDALMIEAMVHRWADLGYQLDRFIYIFENQPLERALCWAVRRSFPNSELVGYQHAGIPKLLLNYHLAPEGEPEAPLPDRIVTVGEITAGKLTEGGYRSDQVIVGGAIQLEEFLAGSQSLPRHPDSEKNTDSVPVVLVAPSDGPEESAELAYLAANLFGKDAPVKVVVKFHPRTPFERIISEIGMEWPDHVEVTNEEIIDLIPNSSLMVYSGSTVAVQAISLGLPVIHVSTKFDFDLDPLEESPDLRLAAMGLEELREKIIWLLGNRGEYIRQHRGDWQSFVGRMYGPITDQAFRQFVAKGRPLNPNRILDPAK